MEDSHDPLRRLVEVLPQAVLQKGELHRGGRLGHTVALGESTDGSGGVAPSPQAAEGGHAGVVPARDKPLFHQLAQLPFAHDRVIHA
ncbi:hypothetical protein SDC9_87979 [bioreactor metagenome]|uniref:Uncharacterized protein n=1 Tax=bioreactor metagenome TaxID=1076179 RepID=A0A644ZKS2_9ZZZZ